MNTHEPEFENDSDADNPSADNPSAKNDEWLSAYLDGELNDAQRQTVEARLAIDPAAQTMLSELQRVRSLVKQLPSWTGPVRPFAAEILTEQFDTEQDADLQKQTAALEAPDAESEAESEESAFDDDELNDVYANEDEVELPLAVPTANVAQTRSSQVDSYRANQAWRWLRPLAIAASLLLMLGVGYALWPQVGSWNLARSASISTAEKTDSAINAPSDSSEQSLASPDDSAVDSAVPPLPSMANAALADGSIAELTSDSGFSGNTLPATEDAAFARSLPNRGGLQGERSELGMDSGAIAENAFGENKANLSGMPSPAIAAAALPPLPEANSDQPLDSPQGNSPQLNAAMPSFAAPMSRAKAMPMEMGEDMNRSRDPSRMEIKAERTTAPAEVRIAHSSHWSNADIAKELATNPALAGLQGETTPAETNAETSLSLASIVLARIPQSVDAAGYFDRALTVNGLTAWELPNRQLANRQLAMSAQQPSQELAESQIATTATADELPPPVGGKAPADKAAVGKSSASPPLSIVLFLNGDEAQKMLDNLAQASPAGTKATYSWIRPAAPNGQSEASGDATVDRVILVLNPAAD